MYSLPYHKEKDPEVVKEFINAHPFAFLSGCNSNRIPVATQIPMFLEKENGKQFLRGHMMKNTDHHKSFIQNKNVLVVFNGPHTYVSGTWYSNPNIPSTWNYMSVHIKGAIQFVEGKGLEKILRKVSLHFEESKETSTTFNKLPKDLLNKIMHSIIGFEIEVLEMDNVFKLSQDRDYESYCNIIEKLNQKGDSEKFIADEMEKRKSKLFPNEY